MNELSVAIEALEANLENLRSDLEKVWESKPLFSVGNFTIENNVYEIKFNHQAVRDCCFYLSKDYKEEKSEFPFQPVNRLSWSSWGYSSIKEEEIEDVCNKSLDYLQAVTEMVTTIKDKTYIPIAKEYWTWVKENIHPLTEKLSAIQSTIENLKTQQKLEATNSDKQKAIQFFKDNEGKEFIFHEQFYYNNKYCANLITIGSFKKDKVQVTFAGTNKWYDEDKMLELYKHIMKTIKIKHTNYEKDYDDASRYTYESFDNLTNQALDKINLKVITKEEYRG